MKALIRILLVASLVSPSIAHALPCPDPPCVPCGEFVDLRTYFVPNYPGWQTAQRIWTFKPGYTSCVRLFQYASGKYELIKNCTGTSTETYTVSSAGIYVTSEMGSPLQAQPRIFNGDGLYFLPAVICTNRNTFRPCHEGETFVDQTSCLTTGSSAPYCFPNLSVIQFAPTWNYGGSLGVIDSIIKIDTLENGDVEKYWFGKNRGLLRWEHYSGGVLQNWGQQTSEISNSPIPHNSCVQP